MIKGTDFLIVFIQNNLKFALVKPAKIEPEINFPENSLVLILRKLRKIDE